MRRLLLLFLLGSSSLFMGCMNTKIKKEEVYEQVDQEGNHVKIYDNVKIVKNGNKYTVNGIIKNDKFTGTKEILLNSKGQKGSFNSPYYGLILKETVEDDRVKTRKYILETEITALNSMYVKTLYKEDIVWADINYPISAEKAGKIRIDTVFLDRINKSYSKLTGSNRPLQDAIYKFINYTNDNSRIKARKKILATYSGQNNDFITFDYYVSNKKVNTEALSREEKKGLVEELVVEQIELINEKLIRLNVDSDAVESFLPDLQKVINIRIQEEQILKEREKNKNNVQEEIIYRDK